MVRISRFTGLLSFTAAWPSRNERMATRKRAHYVTGHNVTGHNYQAHALSTHVAGCEAWNTQPPTPWTRAQQVTEQTAPLGTAGSGATAMRSMAPDYRNNHRSIQRDVGALLPGSPAQRGSYPPFKRRNRPRPPGASGGVNSQPDCKSGIRTRPAIGGIFSRICRNHRG